MLLRLKINLALATDTTQKYGLQIPRHQYKVNTICPRIRQAAGVSKRITFFRTNISLEKNKKYFFVKCNSRTVISRQRTFGSQDQKGENGGLSRIPGFSRLSAVEKKTSPDNTFLSAGEYS